MRNPHQRSFCPCMLIFLIYSFPLLVSRRCFLASSFHFAYILISIIHSYADTCGVSSILSCPFYSLARVKSHLKRYGNFLILVISFLVPPHKGPTLCGDNQKERRRYLSSYHPLTFNAKTKRTNRRGSKEAENTYTRPPHM